MKEFIITYLAGVFFCWLGIVITFELVPEHVLSDCANKNNVYKCKLVAVPKEK